MDLLSASLTEIAQAIRTKKISAVETGQFFLQRTEKFNPQLNAVLSISKTWMNQAQAIDKKVSQGEDPGLLAGVPFGIKDLICTRHDPATAGSKMLKKFVSPYDATLIEKIKAHGGFVLSKLNLDEFAMGSSNETSAFGPVKNPWDLDRVPGGSSGGSAAAQSARLCAASLGTDTGGSIRQPASFTGLVGVKPTYGRISRYGVIAYASSLDQAGPMTTSVSDAALVLEAISGFDRRDSTSSNLPVPSFQKSLNPDLKNIRVGLLKEFLRPEALDPDVQKTFQSAVDFLRQEGAQVQEISVPLSHSAVPIYYLIATSEASSNLARYDGVRFGHRAEFKNLASVDLDDFYSKTRGEGFGKEVKRRIVMGTYCLSSGYFDAYYLKACQVRRLLLNQYKAAFEQCDVILSPVTTSPAFRIGEKISDPLAMYMNDIFTVSANLAGLPGLSVPFGFSKDSLPIGVQVLGNHYQEQRILNLALALEQKANLLGRRPNGF